MLQAWIKLLEFSILQRCLKANGPRASTATQCFVNLFFYLVFCSCRGEMIKGFFSSLCYLTSVYLLAFPHTICLHNAPTFTASCFHTPFSCTYSQVFWGDKVLFISRIHHRWLDLYFVWKTKTRQKTKRLSSCSDHLVQYCTKKWIKGQKLLSKEKCRSWALALVTLRSFTKRDRKNLLEPYKHGYLLWNCHSFELKKKVKNENVFCACYYIYLSKLIQV